MKTDKTKLLQDIEAMRAKLASMEEELNKEEVFKHFPNKGDTYYTYLPNGTTQEHKAMDMSVRTNTYKTREEAQKAYDKAVAIEKIKRRIIELQGDWKPDWNDVDEEVFYIMYYHTRKTFISSCWFTTQSDTTIPCIKNKDISGTIIEEMEDELKLIFDITTTI